MASQKTVKMYARFYPEYTQRSVRYAIEGIKKGKGKLNAITLDYHLRPKRFGGLGKGKLKKVV